MTRGTLAMTQSFTYDPLNRLKTAQESLYSGPGVGWPQTYVYDKYGNRALLSGSFLPAGPMTPQVTADDPLLVEVLYGKTGSTGANNRLTGGLAAHDAAGNVTNPGVTGYNFLYDAENRLTSATTPTGTTAFAYDGEGRRVSKTAGGSTTAFVYDAEGQLAAEYGPVTDYGLKWVFADHLGSTRLLLDIARSGDGAVRLSAVRRRSGERGEWAVGAVPLTDRDSVWGAVYGAGAGWGDGVGLFRSKVL